MKQQLIFLWTRFINFGLAVENQKNTKEYKRIQQSKYDKNSTNGRILPWLGEKSVCNEDQYGENYSVLWFHRSFVLEWVIEALLYINSVRVHVLSIGTKKT